MGVGVVGCVGGMGSVHFFLLTFAAIDFALDSLFLSFPSFHFITFFISRRHVEWLAVGCGGLNVLLSMLCLFLTVCERVERAQRDFYSRAQQTTFSSFFVRKEITINIVQN